MTFPHSSQHDLFHRHILVMLDYSINSAGTKKELFRNKVGSLSHNMYQDKFQVDERFKLNKVKEGSYKHTKSKDEIQSYSLFHFLWFQLPVINRGLKTLNAKS